MSDNEHVPNKGGKNWVSKTGGLPDYISRIAKDLMDKGMPESQAIATAVNTVKRWARGEGNTKPDTKAKAAAALADWERKKAQSHVNLAVGLDRTGHGSVPAMTTVDLATQHGLKFNKDVQHDQGELVNLGLLGKNTGRNNGADGLLGKHTAKAIKAFQKAHGLPATGNLDHATRYALKHAAASGSKKPAPASGSTSGAKWAHGWVPLNDAAKQQVAADPGKFKQMREQQAKGKGQTTVSKRGPAPVAHRSVKLSEMMERAGRLTEPGDRNRARFAILDLATKESSPSFHLDKVRDAWNSKESARRQAQHAKRDEARQTGTPTEAIPSPDYRHVHEVWNTHLIVRGDGGSLHKVPYTPSADGSAFQFGPEKRVQQTYVELSEDGDVLLGRSIDLARPGQRYRHGWVLINPLAPGGQGRGSKAGRVAGAPKPGTKMQDAMKTASRLGAKPNRTMAEQHEFAKANQVIRGERPTGSSLKAPLSSPARTLNDIHNDMSAAKGRDDTAALRRLDAERKAMTDAVKHKQERERIARVSAAKSMPGIERRLSELDAKKGNLTAAEEAEQNRLHTSRGIGKGFHTDPEQARYRSVVEWQKATGASKPAAGPAHDAQVAAARAHAERVAAADRADKLRQKQWGSKMSDAERAAIIAPPKAAEVAAPKFKEGDTAYHNGEKVRVVGAQMAVGGKAHPDNLVVTGPDNAKRVVSRKDLSAAPKPTRLSTLDPTARLSSVHAEQHLGHSIQVQRHPRKQGFLQVKIGGNIVDTPIGRTNADAQKHIDAAKATINDAVTRPGNYHNGEGTYALHHTGQMPKEARAAADAHAAQSAPKPDKPWNEIPKDYKVTHPDGSRWVMSGEGGTHLRPYRDPKPSSAAPKAAARDARVKGDHPEKFKPGEKPAVHKFMNTQRLQEIAADVSLDPEKQANAAKAKEILANRGGVISTQDGVHKERSPEAIQKDLDAVAKMQAGFAAKQAAKPVSFAPEQRVHTEFGPGTVKASTGRSITITLDDGQEIGMQTGTPGYDRLRKANASGIAAPEAKRDAAAPAAGSSTSLRSDEEYRATPAATLQREASSSDPVLAARSQRELDRRAVAKTPQGKAAARARDKAAGSSNKMDIGTLILQKFPDFKGKSKPELEYIASRLEQKARIGGSLTAEQRARLIAVKRYLVLI